MAATCQNVMLSRSILSLNRQEPPGFQIAYLIKKNVGVGGIEYRAGFKVCEDGRLDRTTVSKSYHHQSMVTALSRTLLFPGFQQPRTSVPAV